MTLAFHKRGIIFLTFLGLGMLCAPLFAADDSVVVVLSSNMGPYKEALQGFEEAFGRSVPSYTLSDGEPDIPSDTRLIIAIGGKAALHPYSSKPLLIYCLAPGTKIRHDDHPGQLLKIHTSPSIYLSISRFKELQPSLKRLAVIWSGDSIQDYIDQTKDISERLGVQIISDRIQNPDSLPDHLRALKGKADAIWLPPDATMITPKNFATIKEFSIANGLPFYVPSEGLVEQGATASVYATFKEIGALTAGMAYEALEGSLKVDRVFPEKSHTTVNLQAAARIGLTISADVLKKCDRVIQ